MSLYTTNNTTNQITLTPYERLAYLLDAGHTLVYTSWDWHKYVRYYLSKQDDVYIIQAADSDQAVPDLFFKHTDQDEALHRALSIATIPNWSIL